MIQIYKGTLSGKKQLSGDVLGLTFDLAPSEELIFQAGQYMIVFVPQEGKEPARRLFSISTSTTDTKRFDLVAKIIPGGVASEYFKKLEVGQETVFQGPAGGFLLRQNNLNKTFLATGTGIAPMMSFLRTHLKNITVKVNLYWGLRLREEVYFLDELKELKKNNPHFNFALCLSQEKDMNKIAPDDQGYFVCGRVTAKLDADTSQKNIQEYYICGNRNVVEGLKTYFLERQVPKEQVIAEKF